METTVAAELAPLSITGECTVRFQHVHNTLVRDATRFIEFISVPQPSAGDVDAHLRRRMAALIRSGAGPGAGAWLTALPGPWMGGAMRPHLFRLLLFWRLGLPIPGLADVAHCRCAGVGGRRPSDPVGRALWARGDHFASCGKDGVAHARHDACCQKALAPMCRAAGFRVLVETRGGYGAEPHRSSASRGGERSRPDISVSGFPFGAHETVVDASFTNPMAASYVTSAASNSGSAAAARETSKRAEHPDLARLTTRPGYALVFRGLAWEAAGHPGKDAYRFTREVAQVYACGTSDLGHKKDREESIRYNRFVRQWRTRTSVLLLEGTARAIWTLAFGRLPSGVGDDLAFGQMGHIEPQVHAHP
jgi:hypothetical protein